MNTPNPVIYEFCRSAWEKYRREEDLPVQSLPALVPESAAASGAGRLFKALRGIFASHTPATRSQRRHKVQRAAAG